VSSISASKEVNLVFFGMDSILRTSPIFLNNTLLKKHFLFRPWRRRVTDAAISEPGTNVTIWKIFFAEKWRQNWQF
jgi:hypothetical protein